MAAPRNLCPHNHTETVAIFLWPADQPFVGRLLHQQLSPFCFCLLARTAALSPRLAFRNFPSGATGAGAGAAEAEAETEAEAV
jgi:hypothetical protein